EQALGDLEVPELVLDDDGHLLCIFRLQVLRDANAGGIGEKRDEEVVLARQMPGDSDLGQNLADDAAQRVLSENVIANVVLRHPFLSFFQPLYSGIACLLTPSGTSHLAQL